MSVFGAATQARQRFALNNSVAILIALINGALTYVVLASGHGVVTLVATTTSVSLLGYVAYAWTARVAFPEMSLKPSMFSRSLVREVTSLSVYFFMVDIAIQVGMNLDNVVIGAFIGTSAVAVYSVAMRLADYQRQLAGQFNALLFPVIVRLGSTGRSEALREMLVQSTMLALAMIVGVTICMLGFAAPLIELWMGPGFEQSVATLYILGVTSVVLVAQGPLGSVLLGTGRHRIVAILSLADAVLNLGLSLILVKPLGMLGVAAGTGIPVLVLNTLVILPLACRTVGIGVLGFVRTIVRPSLAGSVPAAALCVALRIGAPPHSMLAVIGEGALVGVAYLAGLLAFGLTADVRALFATRVMRLTRAVAVF
jgi:O-antigen/teichoic acid export membrane protein